MNPSNTKFPLLLDEIVKDRIKTMAFDGCNYYFLTACSKKIVKTNCEYKVIGTYKTCRNYSAICYDFKEHCFWAASAKSCGKIFKLNCSLREIDCIMPCTSKIPTGIIIGISYNCCNDSLLVAFAGCVVEVNKTKGGTEIKYKTEQMWITSILSLCPGFIITGIIEGKQYIYMFDSCCGITNSYCVEHGCIVNNLIFNPCNESCNEPMLEFLITSNGCYSYIVKVPLQNCELYFTPLPCNYLICGESCSGGEGGGSACTDVMESIALVETALSHILNAEGEKLQKVLATTNDIDKILCVNKEINRTIINATHLEHTLYAKLSILCDGCADECGMKCGCQDFCCDESCEPKEDQECYLIETTCDCDECIC